MLWEGKEVCKTTHTPTSRGFAVVSLDRVSEHSRACSRFPCVYTRSNVTCSSQHRWKSSLERSDTTIYLNIHHTLILTLPKTPHGGQPTASGHGHLESNNTDSRAPVSCVPPSYRVSSMPSSEEQYRPDRLRRRPTQLSQAPSTGSLAHISAPPASCNTGIMAQCPQKTYCIVLFIRRESPKFYVGPT